METVMDSMVMTGGCTKTRKEFVALRPEPSLTMVVMMLVVGYCDVAGVQVMTPLELIIAPEGGAAN